MYCRHTLPICQSPMCSPPHARIHFSCDSVVTQCVWYLKHNACMMHVIHCTISSVSCSVTLILFVSLHKHASAYAMNEAQYFVLLFIIWLLWIQLFIAIPPFTVSSPWSVLYGLNSPKDLLHSFNPSLLISLPAFHSQGEWEADLWR